MSEGFKESGSSGTKANWLELQQDEWWGRLGMVANEIGKNGWVS